MSTHPFFKNLIDSKSLKGQVAIITGSSRGIGREIALVFAKAGCNIVVTGKSSDVQKTLPGTIYSVAKEVKELGVESLAIKLDVRDEENVKSMVDQVIKKFGKIDILINNAGALWWKKVIDTPMKRYDLINDINARGSFVCTKTVLPHMLERKRGHIIVMSPPISLELVPGKVAYCISKFGMTLLAHGLAEETRGKGIAINALWPATMVESYATKNFKLGNPSMWRKASILSDCCLALCSKHPKDSISGKALIDDEYLSQVHGLKDFKFYRFDPKVEPPRMTSAPTFPEVGLARDVKSEMKISVDSSSKSVDSSFKSDSIFEDLKVKINEDIVKEVDGSYLFVLKGDDKAVVRWLVDLKNDKGNIKKLNEEEKVVTDCTLILTDDLCYKIMTSQVDSTDSFLSGELKVKGDMGMAMKLSSLQSLVPVKSKL